MQRKSTGNYPQNWSEIANRVKADAGWKCIRCGHRHEPDMGFCLTVHHIDINPENCEWWNLAALCQKCHLQIQAKVFIDRPYMFEHTAWFKPYAAGYYAFKNGLPHDRDYVLRHLDQLLDFGRPFPIYESIERIEL